ncbi:MAG: F0F1 ATP synthase subunit B [Oscillospiraceae bacterium]|nr:F0F1 ATP synthase subunit B [Oscillospiraceae bacterium]
MITAVSDGRLFGLDGQMLISAGIQLFNASVLAAALAFILYKPVRKFLQARTEKIKAQLTGAEESRARADELKASYEKKLEGIESERIGVLDSANELAAQRSGQMIADAQEKIAAMKEQAEAEIAARRERADEETRRHIIEVAGALAEKFMSLNIDEDTQNRLFDETIANLEGVSWKN